jgi:hypothetical protein
MHMLMPPRFRCLLIDSDAGPLYSVVSSSIPLNCTISSLPSARFLLLLATGCSIWNGTVATVDLEGEQRGRGAEQHIWREGRIRRGKWSSGETSGGEGGAALEGIPIGISHARRGRGTWATWWARPAHFLLLLLSFSFFLFFFLHHLLL